MNWINYRTGIKFINFKMDATATDAYLGIEISHPDAILRELYFNHFKTFKKALEEISGKKWMWEEIAVNSSGNEIARIYIKHDKLNVFEESSWPSIISFFKSGIIKLDEFWNEYRDIFEMLT